MKAAQGELTPQQQEFLKLHERTEQAKRKKDWATYERLLTKSHVILADAYAAALREFVRTHNIEVLTPEKAADELTNAARVVDERPPPPLSPTLVAGLDDVPPDVAATLERWARIAAQLRLWDVINAGHGLMYRAPPGDDVPTFDFAAWYTRWLGQMGLTPSAPYLKMPTDKVSSTMLLALQTNRWVIQPDELPKQTHGEGGLSYLEPSDATPAALEELFEELTNARAGDVLLLLLHRTLTAWNYDGPLPVVRFTADELCEAMGYAPHHKGGFRAGHRAAAAKAVRQLLAFRHRVSADAASSAPAGTTAFSADDAFPVVYLARAREVRFTPEGTRHEVAWTLQAAPWLLAFKHMWTLLPLEVARLSSNVRRERWPKLLCMYLVTLFRTGIDEGGTRTVRVRTLLEGSELLPDALNEKEHGNPGRAREYLQGALDALVGMKAGIVGWRYVDADAGDSTVYGWFEGWLDARVLVDAAPDSVQVRKRVEAARKRPRKQ